MMLFRMTIAALVLSCSAASAETLYYGSRAGMVVTVVKKQNLGTTHAKIRVKHTKANATEYCREYEGKVTAKCIAGELKEPMPPEISANCKTGKFITLSGLGYHFLGPNPEYDPTGDVTEYRIVQAGESEPLDGSSASGYDVALGQFKALCPNRAQ